MSHHRELELSMPHESREETTRSRRDFLSHAALSGTALAVWGRVSLAEAQERPAPQQVQLDGLKLAIHTPRIVAETSQGRCWYPDLLKFSTGELMLNHSLNVDSNENTHNSQAVYVSSDQGQTFPFAYDVNGFHNGGGEPRVSLDDGTIVGTSTFLKPRPDDQARRFVAHRWVYDQGGRRYCVEPWGAVVEGLPRDVDKRETSRTWWNRINWFSDILRLEDRWIATLSLNYKGEKLSSTVALVSGNQGRHWNYLATIADANSVPGASEGFDEPCLVQLAGGDLMCISRVGAGADQKLARTYTSDGGKTWSKLDRLPAYSVAPQICRAENGLFALATGRPGIFLWLSDDLRATNWQSFDLIAHHNARLSQSEQMTAAQTTAYTAMVEVSPNRIFLVYDHTPFGWGPVPASSGKKSRIYLVEIGLQRT
jgi:hypothetical protein